MVRIASCLRRRTISSACSRFVALRYRGFITCQRSSASVAVFQDSVTVFSDDFVGRLAEPHVPGGHNIILNPSGPNDTFSHIELERECLRLEFTDVRNETYREFASLFLESEAKESSSNSGESNSLLRHCIKDIKNNTFCGAGATVLLHRNKIARYLKMRGRGSRDGEAIGVGKGSEDEQ